MTIGICTDSLAQMPRELVDRFGVAVVPVTVRLGECEYLEGVDLAPDEYFARVAGANGEAPDGLEVTISHPSPGQFALAYDELAERGCTQILSVHAGADVSGTMNAARLAAHSSPVAVRLVDTGTRSFGVSGCIWAAADAIAAGASLEEAAAVAEALAPRIGSLYVVDAFGLLTGNGPADVLTLQAGRVEVVARVEGARAAVDAMADAASRWSDEVRVGVGTADCRTAPLADALAAALAHAPNVREVARYRIGPSVAAHTGPATVGCFIFPTGPAPSTPAAS